ncbi:hypothetical protein [Arcobacter aquimarinus]|uniref:hypothetical protein n=1 Tax=Arcobacter aquimarinus TaxID=1315211 RepID=UPI003BB0456D
MSSFSNIPKDELLINKIRLACNQFETSFNLKRGEARNIIIKNLGLKSVKELNNYFTTSEKYLRVEQLFLILDIFETEQQKIILDYIANKYDFVLSKSANNSNITLNPDFSIFNINAVSGALNSKYFEFKNNDNVLDEEEISNLLEQSYLARQSLVNFEKNLKGLLND